ncbi:methylation-associated defense system protein kinase MAD6 [Nocardia asiatica]|uniref:methylation-associated defense system protein kinase MAD6 n=1 Tax=Nocardia asiatica TaxID=209252 RepID=UPI00245545C0|nr:protein kinase [Nocardia asiatica]
MAEIVGGGPPVNDAERAVIAHLRDHAPADWWVLHNIEIPVHGSRYEVDVIVVTGHAVCLIDVKGTRGRIEVSGHRWFPEGRAPFGSPVAKLNGHARAYKGRLEKLKPALRAVFVDALVVLTAPNAVLVDPSSAPGADANSVTSLDGMISMLADVSRVRAGLARDLTKYRSDLLAALTGSVQQPTGPRRFGHWTVVERLGGTDDVTEFRAVNGELGGSETVLLKVYRVDPFQPEAQRDAERNAIANAYRVLARMPAQECVVGSRDFFPTEDEDQFVQVLDDPHGRALHACLADTRNPMSTDVKIRVIADVLRGLAWAHAHKVIHRALSPTTVLVKPNGRAMLTGFDYARPEGPRTMTVQGKLGDVLDPAYVAPECQGRVQQMSRASDVYAAGVIAFQLLTGELPFTTTVEQHEKGSMLPTSVLARAGVSEELAALLQRMCALAPSARPAAAETLQQFGRIVGGRGQIKDRDAKERHASEKTDLRHLLGGHQLTPQFTIRRKLGAGTFGVVYQVYDNLAGADRVVKIVDHDRESEVERLRQEYKILLGLPPHPNLVKVESAGYLEGGTVPYLVFEYLEGRDLRDLLKEGALNPADALAVGRDLARGLVFLHGRGVYHCDMKSNNVFRTDLGCKILDFNVAVTADSSLTRAGGNHRYAPPDVADCGPMDAARLIDRDVYGAGLILYEALTGSWPFENLGRPVLSELARDPREFSGLGDLSDEFVAAVLKAISPLRGDRFGSAEEFRNALEAIGDSIRRPRETPLPEPLPVLTPGTAADKNPFVAHLQTLYSQSTISNVGTRGHDPHKLYVATLLDTELRKDVLDGRYRLVVITGNAGDGKTAFLEALVTHAIREGATTGPPRINGANVRLLNGTWLRTNYDGSQDEGERANDDVLLDFFAPYQDGTVPDGDVRLIAINEGRLVDFCAAHGEKFTSLTRAVQTGLEGGAPYDGIVVVNLNRRSLVADRELDGSIFERILVQMTAEKNWEACGSCELAQRCYARHNATTLGHPNAGPKVVGRLKNLYTLTHLRSKLHMTVRDVRSVLAYTLTSGRRCDQIHDLYRGGNTQAILDGFYFNSWAGLPDAPDRLLTLLRDVDVAKVPEPALDRKLDYVGPDAGQALMNIDGRDNYDLNLLEALFAQLPRTPKPTAAQAALHSNYLAAARRRFFFECLDEQRVQRLLPYRSAATFLELLESPVKALDYLTEVIDAINRGEGLPEPGRFGGDLALQIREVVGGTIRSYRLFPRENFSLSVTGSDIAPYLEVQLEGLLLRHRAGNGHEAQLRIGLDLFELLYRLRHGYLPGIADEQGLLLGLTIFKNELAAAPYQEILLTSGGEDLHRVQRYPDGRLAMRHVAMEANWWH